MARARHSSVVNCVVKALVEATPISGPAWVTSTASLSRAMELCGTLTMLRIGWPDRRTRRSASSVSIVSPDCETKSDTPPAASGGSR